VSFLISEGKDQGKAKQNNAFLIDGSHWIGKRDQFGLQKLSKKQRKKGTKSDRRSLMDCLNGLIANSLYLIKFYHG
jgi:hypothetical protein